MLGPVAVGALVTIAVVDEVGARLLEQLKNICWAPVEVSGELLEIYRSTCPGASRGACADGKICNEEKKI